MLSFQSAKEETKRAADIVEVIGQYVQLRKAGSNFTGLCPFHSEKAPSFSVSPSKQMFHCFGCKKGGDVFAFWMEYHKVSFSQALRDLAEKYNIPLPDEKTGPEEKRQQDLKESLCMINRTAAEFYHRILRTEKGKPGRDYLEKRELSGTITADFMLGYAPGAWDELTRFFIKKKVDMNLPVQAGLIAPKKNGGYYDRFRERVLFPIFDMRKDIVGFGGRVLNDALPKYLNTPETLIFQKRKLFYGIHDAYPAIRQSGRAVVVEGYTDVLSLRQNGFYEAVATLGTALTADHVRNLKGYAGEVVILFDADTAGNIAAMKSLPVFLREGIQAKVMVLPEGHDPDTFVKRHGLDAFIALLDRAEPMFDFYIGQKLGRTTGGIETRVGMLEDILPLLGEIENEARRSLYIRRLAEKLEIPESAVWAEFRKLNRTGAGCGAANNLKTTDTRAVIRDDLPLLNLLVHHPRSTGRLLNQEFKTLLSDSVSVRLFEHMVQVYSEKGEITPSELLETIEGQETGERLREVMIALPICRDDEVDQAIAEFENGLKRKKIAELKKTALEQGNMEVLNKIPKLLKSILG